MCLPNFMKFRHCLFKILKNQKSRTDGRTLRITKDNDSKIFGSYTYFSIINIHLLDINVFAKFYEIPSLPFQDIEKPKLRGKRDGQRKNSIPPNTVCGVINM